MSTLADLLAENTRLPGEAADHLQTVVAEWQLLADLSFADFVLWVPVAEGLHPGGGDFVCVAHVRPTTAPTAHPEDVVGARFTVDEHPQLAKAMREVRICRDSDSGTIPKGAASSTSAAVLAAARRSLSRFMRKLAIAGT